MTEPHLEIDAFGVAWRLGATLFFVALNGFFVAAEFALVRVRSSRVEGLALRGNRSARTVQHIARHLDLYLSSCQLGITIASLILGALGEPAVSVLIRVGAEALGLHISEGARWLPVVSLTLAFTLITMLHMTIGEQAPKMWALRRAEKVAFATANTLYVFTMVFRPFIHVINVISNWMLRLIGLPQDNMHDLAHTAQEIRGILLLAAAAGHISDRERELTENVFRMMELEVRHIMVPRVDVEFLSLDRTIEENLERIRTSGYSRLPLCQVGLDTILGFIHVKDVFELTLQGKAPDLKALARESLFVSDTMPLSNFLVEVQNNRQHCGVAVDEHGSVVGLAFREDALEEIVGPLGDEFDVHEASFVQLPNGAYEVLARLPLPELCGRLNIELPDDQYEDVETVGGQIVARLGRLPRKGDTTQIGPYRATVLEIQRRRIHRVRLELPEPVIEDAPKD